MTAELPAADPIFCDGCAQQATPEHLRRRIARLEWASRFRPVRIGTLFLAPTPAEEMEDYFYFPDGKPRDPAAAALQEDLLASCGIAPSDAANRKASLEGFQQGGFFLADCVECPTGFSGGEEFDALISRLLPTLLRRIRFSYQPKTIVLISEQLNTLMEAIGSPGTDREPFLPGAQAISLPEASDTAGRRRFRAEIAALLGRSGGPSA